MVVMGSGGLNDGYGSDTARTVHVGERCDPATPQLLREPRTAEVSQQAILPLLCTRFRTAQAAQVLRGSALLSARKRV